MYRHSSKGRVHYHLMHGLAVSQTKLQSDPSDDLSDRHKGLTIIADKENDELSIIIICS